MLCTYLITGKAGREKIWLRVFLTVSQVFCGPALNVTKSISIFYRVFEFFWLSDQCRSVLFSSGAVVVFPALSLEVYGLQTGLFFIWFSKEIARGAERFIW